MTSLYPSLPLSITANNGASPLCPFLMRNHKSKASKVTKPSQYYVSRVSCKATKDSNDTQEPINDLGMFDRRNMLIGLGAGLYGTAATLNNDPLSLAAPIPAPDLSLCQDATPPGVDPMKCCPRDSEPIPFTFPVNPKVKVRPAAHLIYDNPTYIRNYKEAICRMKALPADDPRSFTSQANVHCAYCNGAYQQPGTTDPDHEIDVHFSWLFFPFHRWYIYFFERILASLIPDLDPNFALPFWSWDSPKGMRIPYIYTECGSPLYDPLRNQKHLPPRIIDLNFTGTDLDIPPEVQIQNNLSLMHSQMFGATNPCLFFGAPYRAGEEKDPGMGAIENVPHNLVHFWTGVFPSDTSHGEDMGIFYSAARDPIFYAHHANVDRMWPIWKSLPGGIRRDFHDSDWLDTEFVFYDETSKLVRVNVRDCLDTEKLGYVYQDINIPWLLAKPSPRVPKGSKKKPRAGGAGEGTKFPLVLDSIVSTVVKRPRKSRSKEEKEKEEEVLVIEGIEFDGHLGLKFDVHINDEDVALSGPMNTEFVGSFLHVPHSEKHKDRKDSKMKTNHRFGISGLLEDLGAEDDEDVLVTLVPQFGKGPITIGGIKIEIEADCPVF